MLRANTTWEAVRVAAIYALVAGVWVFFTDEILALVVPDREAMTHLSIAKGWVFVVVTALLLFLLVQRAMKALGQSRDFYLKIFEEFPALIWRSGTDARCDYFNRTWLAFTGRTLDQELGEGWVQGVHPDDREQCLAIYREAFAARQPFVQEYRLRRHDGEYRWVVDHARPLYDRRDIFIGYIGSCQDVTERRQAEEGLSQSERRYRELTENTSDWVWQVDGSMRYVYSSPKVSDLLGYTPTEVLGKTPFDLMTPEEAARLRQAFDGLAANPQSFREIENVNVHKDGSLVVLETSGVPVQDAAGCIVGFRGIDRDITRRKRAEERILALNAELAQQAEALEAANQELEAFCHTASHDLRTPLTGISLSCQVIAELCGEKISSQCMTTLRGIIASTEWMDQLITSLLTLSGISRSELNLESVDLSEMARVIAAELRLSQPERRATFAIAEGGTAHGDANLLRLAMANLLGNAWKYTARTEAAVIEFGVNESEGERTYFVRDNGIGFDMGQAGRLFAPFQRLHGAREYEGHGIGLATVQRIVQRHGGRVWAEGEVGRGATFCFTLPPEEPPPVSS